MKIHWIFRVVSLFNYQGSVCLRNFCFIDRQMMLIIRRRRRDLNPRAAINDLLPFQGSPFSLLGTSPNKLNCYSHSIWQRGAKAERVGFEPTRPCGQTVFKTASLWPLRYLSILFALFVERKNDSSKDTYFCQQLFLYFHIFLSFHKNFCNFHIFRCCYFDVFITSIY